MNFRKPIEVTQVLLAIVLVMRVNTDLEAAAFVILAGHRAILLIICTTSLVICNEKKNVIMSYVCTHKYTT